MNTPLFLSSLEHDALYAMTENGQFPEVLFNRLDFKAVGGTWGMDEETEIEFIDNTNFLEWKEIVQWVFENWQNWMKDSEPTLKNKFNDLYEDAMTDIKENIQIAKYSFN